MVLENARLSAGRGLLDRVGPSNGPDALQVKKVRTIQAAFETFSSMMKTQGRADLTTMELRVGPVCKHSPPYSLRVLPESLSHTLRWSIVCRRPP